MSQLITGSIGYVYTIDPADGSKFSVTPIMRDMFGQDHLIRTMVMPDLQIAIPHQKAKLCSLLDPVVGNGTQKIKVERKGKDQYSVDKDDAFGLIVCANIPAVEAAEGEEGGFLRRQLIVSMPYNDTADVSGIHIDHHMSNRTITSRIMVTAILFAERASREHGAIPPKSYGLASTLSHEYAQSYIANKNDNDSSILSDFIKQRYIFKRGYAVRLGDILKHFRTYVSENRHEYNMPKTQEFYKSVLMECNLLMKGGCEKKDRERVCTYCNKIAPPVEICTVHDGLHCVRQHRSWLCHVSVR